MVFDIRVKLTALNDFFKLTEQAILYSRHRSRLVSVRDLYYALKGESLTNPLEGHMLQCYMSGIVVLM